MSPSLFSRFMQRSPVVANLIAVNVLLLAMTYVLRNAFGVDLLGWLGLYHPLSASFRPHQVFTHMFMHGGVEHLFFNMFALYMFGGVLEGVFGSRRFLFYYLFTGLGAAGLHMLVTHIELLHVQSAVHVLMEDFTPDSFSGFVQSHFSAYYGQVASQGLDAWFAAPDSSELAWRCKSLVDELVRLQVDVPTVGASGAVFGILLGFGVLFPNHVIQLLIPPIPLKAKWFVLIYGGLELVLGIYQPGSSVAHFAHVGGMLFGYVLLLIWKRNGTLYRR